MLVPCSLALLFSASFQLTQAVHVYLSPSPSLLRSTLSPEDASATLSRHLGLEAFEPFWDASDLTHIEENFVGQGPKNVLVVTVEESDASAVIPYSLQHAFILETQPSTPISSLSSVVSTYLHRANIGFASIFSSFNFGELEDVSSLVTFFDAAEEPSFAAIELSKLHDIGKTYGHSSEKYIQVANKLRALLEEMVEDDRFTVAVLTFATPSSASLVKRQAPQETQAPLPSDFPAPQLPIGGISTCFTSLDGCNNGTSVCSGRGKCVEASKAGRSCFVCNCGVTKTGEGNKVKTDYWAGESCERKDISGPFVLLAGTVITIILLIGGSVTLLYGVGDQPLPSTLMATAVNARRD
ncbi:hypothetical protein GALMADRAFT_249028 [Galerina marginata CBS 339.88]|uniref:Vacuolar sorting protein Vps3844 C-terminal domain-containing protein n=1 Tax=Galerina marginata (strain CBS 339.88) TaxID=685588 RepID=A0A067SW05_GALM3|nr:hypothetical protein GALMADRAFT_249028 [Galerina marginata CBS 339.88]